MTTQVPASMISSLPTVQTADLAASSVTTAKIADANVTTVKIADANVTPAKLSQPLTQGTAVAASNNTAFDFTSIPSWVKRVTIAFNGISTNGTSAPLVQIGSGSVTTTGYLTYGGNGGTSSAGAGYTTGFGVSAGSAANLITGLITIMSFGSNSYVATASLGFAGGGSNYFSITGGSVTLSGALDRVRITTVNGTDTFDAGSVNILYE